ncbi:hypothetical protein FQN57_005779 [Myotisia sp. PD_48]|nr:hypothetical protein FQN57_005779 [Myotisia sp. PD_48]
MLRRKPTALTITSEDIIAFEESRLRRQNDLLASTTAQTGKETENRNAPGTSLRGGLRMDPNDELKPLPGDKARIVRSREDRIGLGG